MEKNMYPAIAAAAALFLTAAAISASIIYVSRQGAVSENPSYEAPSYPPLCRTALSVPRAVRPPYGTFTPIDSVMDINEYMTRHPVILTAEETLPYICAEDSAAEQIKKTVLDLSNEICRNAETDREKATAIAMWVGTNTAYDFDIAETGVDTEAISLEAVLSNELRTTCGGFANMYSALCSAQGIYCLNMKGGTSSEGYTRAELETAPANHEWNAVMLDGLWYYADCTWISDLSFKDGEYSGGKTEPFYSLFDFGEMSVEHRIDRCEYRDFGFGE